MNDITINRKNLKKFKGKLRSVVEDVPYTRDQIKTLVDRATLRDRCVILIMLLQASDLEPYPICD
jgi:hypothetical protein